MTTKKSFEFDVFLSHSHFDKKRVRNIAKTLKKEGLKVWFDEWVIEPGEDIYLAIEHGLQQSHTLILCLSQNALSSDWLTLERNTAIFRDPSNKSRRFIPILLEKCKLPETLSRYKYIDFTHDDQSAIKELLKVCSFNRKNEYNTPSNITLSQSETLEENNHEQEEINPSINSEPFNLPLGVNLLHSLHGHKDWIGRISWSPNGKILASPSADGTIRLWDTKTGENIKVIETGGGWVYSVNWSPDSQKICSGSADGIVRVWTIEDGNLQNTFKGHESRVYSVTWSKDGQMIASGSMDTDIIIWDVLKGKKKYKFESWGYWVNSLTFSPDGKYIAAGTGEGSIDIWELKNRKLKLRLVNHTLYVVGVAWSPDGQTIASASYDKTIRIWDSDSGKQKAVLEGHTEFVNCVSFSSDSQFLVSKSIDTTIRIWSCLKWQTIATIKEPSEFKNKRSLDPYYEKELIRNWPPGITFHPNMNCIATSSSYNGMSKRKSEYVINIYEIDFELLLNQVSNHIHYLNAKVVLVGDTGVGKSGLSLVLNNHPFEATDSTPGRRVWTLNSEEVEVGKDLIQSRETLLWDLAGQPGYRIIHQLHLNEVAVALLVFDARSETDPLAGVRYWDKALRLAQQRQGKTGVPMKKFLVSARNDRGGISISEERLQGILKEYAFDGYFKTSSKEGWQISELQNAIKNGIVWEDLPVVSSSKLFTTIKGFLLDIKKTGRLLASIKELYLEFERLNKNIVKDISDLPDQFITCIGRLENRDLIRRLTFGGYVLLQPELLDAYASAMVNTARDEPDGLGSISEDIALSGRFFIPKEQKVSDNAQEQLLLHATIEELVKHELALRENADEGRFLVFPSQFNRDFENAPVPKGKEVMITFEGPVQSLYATLVVRISHCGLFTTHRLEMWRNAAIFNAVEGGKCGIFLNEFSEGKGRLTLFYEEHVSIETKFHFENFVLSHAKRNSIQNTVDLVRFFVCQECGEPVPENYVKHLKEKGFSSFNCPCGGVVILSDPKERISFNSKVKLMDSIANKNRDFDRFIMSAKGETNTLNFQKWAGGERITLAIVFTEIILGEKEKDASMIEIRRRHFSQARKLIQDYSGNEIKTIGDSILTAFKSADIALDYALNLQKNPGHEHIHIRAGIHLGLMHVEENDVFGGTVNFVATLVRVIKNEEIWLSDRAKEDIVRFGAEHHKKLLWRKYDNISFKGFSENFTLWSVKTE